MLGPSYLLVFTDYGRPSRAPVDHEEIIKTLLMAFHYLGGGAIISLLEQTGEPVFDSMKGYEAAAAAGEDCLGPTKLRMMTIKRNQLQKAYLDRWQATASDGKGPLDGIIMAVSPWAAPRLGATEKNSYVGYTGVGNLLGERKYLLICREHFADVKKTSQDAPSP